MILTGNEIERQVKLKKITLTPFSRENINPNSYNYRLGKKILEINEDVIDPKKPSKYKEITMDSRGYTLMPKKIYLGHTFENIGSDDFLTILVGRSSVGRLGLYLQITADLGHMGSKHNWTLELHVVQPLKVYPLMKIGQVSFWEVFGDKKNNYNGKYQKYNDPHISEIYNELN